MSQPATTAPLQVTQQLRESINQMLKFGSDTTDVLFYLGALSLGIVDDVYDDAYDRDQVEALLIKLGATR